MKPNNERALARKMKIPRQIADACVIGDSYEFYDYDGIQFKGKCVYNDGFICSFEPEGSERTVTFEVIEI